MAASSTAMPRACLTLTNFVSWILSCCRKQFHFQFQCDDVGSLHVDAADFNLYVVYFSATRSSRGPCHPVEHFVIKISSDAHFLLTDSGTKRKLPLIAFLCFRMGGAEHCFECLICFDLAFVRSRSWSLLVDPIFEPGSQTSIPHK